ncbi:hypothetical protein [Spongiactinospora sp. 9N601]
MSSNEEHAKAHAAQHLGGTEEEVTADRTNEDEDELEYVDDPFDIKKK